MAGTTVGSCTAVDSPKTKTSHPVKDEMFLKSNAID